jgi:hypothetical protein
MRGVLSITATYTPSGLYCPSSALSSFIMSIVIMAGFCLFVPALPNVAKHYSQVGWHTQPYCKRAEILNLAALFLSGLTL